MKKVKCCFPVETTIGPGVLSGTGIHFASRKIEASCFLYFIYLFIYFVFLHFLGPLLRHMDVPRLGVNRSCSNWPTPEPQQRRI